MLLTDEEIYATWGEAKNEAYSFREFARAIESAVLEKLNPRVAELEAVLRECYYALDAYWDRELRAQIKAIAKIDEVLSK